MKLKQNIRTETTIKTAVILAAGRGTRLEEMTDALPKCLIEVGRKTLLERMLIQLDGLGIQSIVLVVGYQAEKIVRKIGSTFGRLKITFVHNEEWATTNNVLSLYLAADYLLTPFLLLESDLIFESGALESLNSLNAIAIDHFEEFMNGTVVSLSDSGVVNRMYLKCSSNRPSELSELYKTVNIYTLDADDFHSFVVPILKELLDEGRLDVYYELAFERAIERELISFKAIDFKTLKWVEIDDQDDWQRAKRIFQN